VIWIFCERIRRGEPIEVFEDDHPTRDFIFVTDVATALLRAMDAHRCGTALLRAMDARLAGGSVFNDCTRHGASVLELARTIASLCGKSLEIRFRPRRTGEVRHSYGDPTVARQVLGFSTSTELRIGLAATLAGLELQDPVADQVSYVRDAALAAW
jgi:UDP-glucose 4-epimerase